MFLNDEPPYECIECFDKANRLNDIKYWVRAILDQLYGLDDFDADDLEYYAEELGHILNMRIPPNPLAIVRKERTVEITTMLDAWKNASVEYLRNFAKTGS